MSRDDPHTAAAARLQPAFLETIQFAAGYSRLSKYGAAITKPLQQPHPQFQAETHLGMLKAETHMAARPSPGTGTAPGSAAFTRPSKASLVHRRTTSSPVAAPP